MGFISTNAILNELTQYYFIFLKHYALINDSRWFAFSPHSYSNYGIVIVNLFLTENNPVGLFLNE